MTAKDKIHDAVRAALVKDGWTITDDPYTIEHEEVRVYADLAAHRSMVADRGGRRIVVEIKSFAGQSLVYNLEVALGQYMLYRALLGLEGEDRDVYLAVPRETYDDFLSGPAIRVVLQQFGVAMVVVDVAQEEVVTWTR